MESRFLGHFIQECLQLCDISPTRACAIIYGSWPNHRPDMGAKRLSFNEENYLRYSTVARKEVVLALIKCGKKHVLSDVCLGLIEKPNFLQELDLWKEWGVDSGFINTELDDFVSLKVQHYFWHNGKVFADVMNYIDKRLSPQEASDWMCAVRRKQGASDEDITLFQESINQHTI